MNDISYKWLSMSDKALGEQIGVFVKHHRLEQNKTQDGVARAAGMSRSTLSLLERGETVSLNTLLQALRALDLLHVMNAFEVESTISPMALAKMERDKRQRARGGKDKDQNESDW